MGGIKIHLFLYRNPRLDPTAITAKMAIERAVIIMTTISMSTTSLNPSVMLPSKEIVLFSLTDLDPATGKLLSNVELISPTT